VENKNFTNRIALCGIFTALALIFSYVEAIVPLPLGVPGIKMGFANIIIVVALYTMDAKTAFAINILRIIIAGLLFTGVFGMLYSLAGGILSFLSMLIIKKIKYFSILGVSISGGVAHNLGQILTAALIISNIKMFVYFPVLVLSGVVTGTIIGFISLNIINILPASIKVRLHRF